MALSQRERSKQEILTKLDGLDDFVQGRVPFVLSPVRNRPALLTAGAATIGSRANAGAGADVGAGVYAVPVFAAAGQPEYRLSCMISTMTFGGNGQSGLVAAPRSNP